MNAACKNVFTLSGSPIVPERSTMTDLTDLLINWRWLSDRTLWCSWFRSPQVLTSNDLINPTGANTAATGQPKVTHFVSYEGPLSLLINDWTFPNTSGCSLSYDWTCRFIVTGNTLSCLLYSLSLAYISFFMTNKIILPWLASRLKLRGTLPLEKLCRLGCKNMTRLWLRTRQNLVNIHDVQLFVVADKQSLCKCLFHCLNQTVNIANKKILAGWE